MEMFLRRDDRIGLTKPRRRVASITKKRRGGGTPHRSSNDICLERALRLVFIEVRLRDDIEPPRLLLGWTLAVQNLLQRVCGVPTHINRRPVDCRIHGTLLDVLDPRRQ